MKSQVEQLATASLDSGHIIHAPHIESPRKEFRISFYDSSYINVLRFAEGVRWVRVLAETGEGAIEIAQFHYGRRGSRFALIS
jgi:hypothetical protein